MIRQKVLLLAPYPIKKPLHGGQKRVKALYEFYKNNFKDVLFVGVFHRGHYPDWEETDMPIGQLDIINEVDRYPSAAELIVGKAVDKDIHVRSRMAALLRTYQPDIIHIEQPFLYLGMKKLLCELEIRPRMIFGSQNIEYPLKERIFNELHVNEAMSKVWVKETKTIEYDFSREADLIVAVNSEDAATHKKMGAKNIIIACNGIDKVPVTKKGKDYWSTFKITKNINKLVTFVGSGHPPNWEGFLKMIGDDTQFMPTNTKIIVVGGVSDYFKEQYKDKQKYASFWKGVEIIGLVEEDKLSSLLDVTDVIILPITTKRGSNLKTAEAILSGKKIVATEYALHGFEEFARLPNIRIANTMQSFHDTIIESLQTKESILSKSERKLASRVVWESRLHPMLPSIKRLARSIMLERKKAEINQKKGEAYQAVRNQVARIARKVRIKQ